MNLSFRNLGSAAAASALLLSLGLLTAAPATAQGASPSVAQATPPTPPSFAPTLDAAACKPDKLADAIKTLVTADPGSAVDIVTYATQHCPGDAAEIAAAAAGADPTDAAAILVAVIASLPPDQAETELAAIVVAVETVVPGSTDQITAAISQITFSQGPGLQGRGDKGAPLIAPWTDVPDARITSNSPT